MPVQVMNCPKCGRPASEYSPDKWQCMNAKCGIRFIYEPPTQGNATRQKEYTLIVGAGQGAGQGDGQDGAAVVFFRCASCGGEFNKALNPEFRCRSCGAALCIECGVPRGRGLCRECRDRQAALQRKADQRHAATLVRIWVAAFVLSIMITAAIWALITLLDEHS